MSILLTGGAGFIGSCLLWKLNELGRTDVIVVDHLGTTEKWQNLVGKRFDDYLDRAQLLDTLQRPDFTKTVDAVIHLGACSSTTEPDASYLMENNYRYSKALAEWALAHHKRFIYASSGATYGGGEHGYSDQDDAAMRYRPLNMYGYSKHLFDLWVLSHRLQRRFVGLKFFNVYGPNEYHKGDMRSVVHKGYQQIKQGGKMRLFKSHHPDKAGIYNLGTGTAQTWNDLARALFGALGLKPQIEYHDMPEVLRGKYQYFTQADTAKLRAAGYAKPFQDLQAGVADYVKILETTHYL